MKTTSRLLAGLAIVASAGALMVGASTASAAPATIAAAPAASTTTDNQDRRVNITNRTRYTIMEFYASSVGQNDWEEDILGSSILEAGHSVVINIDDGTGYCLYDLKAVFEDGDEAIKYRVNVCQISEFNFTE